MSSTDAFTSIAHYEKLICHAETPAYLIEVTSEKRFIHRAINQAFSDALGLSPDALLHTYVDEIEHVNHRTLLLSKYNAFLNNTYAQEATFSYPFASSQKQYRSLLLPIKNTQGQIAHILGIDQNIGVQSEASACFLHSHDTCMRTMVKSLPGFAYSFKLHLDGKEEFLFASDNVFETYGIRAKTLLNDLSILRASFHPVDKILFKGAMLESVKTLQHFHIEFRYFHPTKGLIWLETRSQPTRQLDGSTIWHGITIDITQRKRAQEALMQTTTHLRSLLNTIPDLVWMKDINGKYLTCNHAFERFFGAKTDVIIGKTDYDFVKQELADFFRQKDLEAIQKGAISTNEETITYNDTGKQGLLETRKAPVYGPNGNLLGVLGLAKDITEQKEAQKMLLMLHNAINSSSDIIFVIDIATAKFIHVNETAVSHLGYTKEALIGGMGVFDVDVSFDPDMWPEHTVQLKKDGMARLETKHRTKEGRIYPVEVTAHYFEYEDKAYNLAVARDISERKLYEKALIDKEHQFRTLAENSPNIIMRYDKTGRRIYVNPAFTKETGIPLEQALNITPKEQWGHYLSPMNMSAHDYQEKMRLVIATAQPDEFTIEWIRNSDGQYVAQQLHMIPEFDAEGNISGILAIGNNITKLKQTQAILETREEAFRALAEYTPDTIARYDVNCLRLYANPALCKAMGQSEQALVGVKPSSYTNSPAAYMYESAIKRVFETGNETQLEYTWPDKNDQNITSHIRIVPERNQNGDIVSVIATGHDITEMKQYEAKLKDNERRLKEAQKIAKMGSFELEFPGLKLTCSDEIYRILELTPFTLEPSYDHFLNLVHPDDKTLVDTTFHTALQTQQPHSLVHRLLMPDNRVKYVFVYAKTLYDVHDKPIRTVSIMQDITEQKLAEKRIEFLAHHDTLTGLPNRALAIDRMERAIAHAKRSQTKTALLFIDMDNFKAINDSLGHTMGDMMIQILAMRLQENLRETDTVSRQGGDEFLIILNDIQTIDDVSVIADKLLAEIQKPIVLETHTLASSISIGIALYPNDGDTFETLLQKADTAMYQAKENGGNAYCFFSEEMNDAILNHLHLLNDLKQALQNNEFELHYQPQIELEHHTLSGIEALLRWNHPQKGLISPAHFIPLAESSGLIVPIGEWVINEACTQAARWCKQGLTCSIAVNISAVQFKRGDLEQTIHKALLHSGLAPHYLELELTESILIQDTEKVLQCVQRLKSLGVKLSIDDFGTGYSSLSYLKRFAVDKLKIDRSFVYDIAQETENSAIVKAIIQIAKSFGLKTIAEGIEHKECVEVLKAYGCDEIQGFYFAKPMPRHAFLEYCALNRFTGKQ
jgi:diguanylate cyclase (GGDEF)-like protein/PAS domain S-box-containing protein